jgi:hypothetical protein
MASDVRLLENDVVAVDGVLSCSGPDIVLDNGARRGTHEGSRRALVHDPNDGLTLNWDGDYPGGVTIRSGVVVDGVMLCSGPDIVLDNGSRRKVSGGRRRALVHDFNDGLTLNWNEDYPGGVTVLGKVQCPNELRVNMVVVKALNEPGLGSGDVRIHLMVDAPGVGIEVPNPFGGPPIHVPHKVETEVSVGTSILELRAQVAALEARIRALGG